MVNLISRIFLLNRSLLNLHDATFVAGDMDKCSISMLVAEKDENSTCDVLNMQLKDMFQLWKIFQQMRKCKYF